jgi:hypothetical protein
VSAFTPASRHTESHGGATTTSGSNGAASPSLWNGVSDPDAIASALRHALRSPLTAEEKQSLTELGVDIVVAILSDPRVRQAVHGLPHSSGEDPFVAPRTTFQTTVAPAAKVKVATSEAPATTTDAAPRSGKMRVLIAGPMSNQLHDVRGSYESQLEVESWSPDQGFEQLRALVDSVDVVIGMPSMLTQAVQNTLRHYARRYLRHTTGIAGLGGELSKLVTGEAK